MNATKTKMIDRFIEVVQTTVRDWANIDELTEAADQNGVFTDEDIESMVWRFKKSAVRGMARRVGKADPSVSPELQMELVSLITGVDAQGQPIRKYKQLKLFDEVDYIQVINERRQRAKYWTNEMGRFVDLACARFGEQFRQQVMFD